MKNIKLFSALIIVMLTVFSITETAEAQTRHNERHGKKRVVRRNVVRAARVPHRVVVRKAHLRYAQLPRWRTSVTVVPTTAVIIKTKTNPYYYDRGVYYAPRNNAYVIVRPTRGMRIRTLPVGYRNVVVGSRNYYYYYGTFYTKINKGDEYETVDAPVGALVDALPDGYEVKTINGTEYYVLDDVYYAEVETDEMEDGIGYEVVKI